MSENSSSSQSSQFSTKRLYVFVAIGILIFVLGTVFSYAAGQHLDAGDLPPEELVKQDRIYAVSKIGTFIGFLIALVPSVKILQGTIQKMRDETTEGSPVSVNEKEIIDEDE